MPPYTLGWEAVIPVTATVPVFDGVNRIHHITVDAPAGKVVLSAGWRFVQKDPAGREFETFPQIFASHSNGDAQWIYGFVKDDIETYDVQLRVICVNRN